MQWVPWMKTCTCTGMSGFLESTRNCPLQFLMDLSNCPQEKHFLELRMLSQETSGRESGPDPIQPVASWLLLDLNFLLGMKAESLPVPSVSLPPISKICSWLTAAMPAEHLFHSWHIFQILLCPIWYAFLLLYAGKWPYGKSLLLWRVKYWNITYDNFL